MENMDSKNIIKTGGDNLGTADAGGEGRLGTADAGGEGRLGKGISDSQGKGLGKFPR